MKIIINNDVAAKLRCYTHFAKGEVSGMAKSEITEELDVVVTDIALFEQTCSAASTELDDGALAKFLDSLTLAGEDPSKWNVWWHTHGLLSVFWSSTDDATISESCHGINYLVSIVTNKAGEYKGRIDIIPQDNSPFGKQFNNVKYDADVVIDIPEEIKAEKEAQEESVKEEISVLETLLKEAKEKLSAGILIIPENEAVKDACEKEIKEKVKEKTYTTTYSGYNRNITTGRYEQLTLESYEKKKKIAEEKQEDFEDALTDIELGIPLSTSIYVPTRDYPMDDVNAYCGDCGELKMYCACKDAIEKHSDYFMEEDEYLLDDYLKEVYYNGADDYIGRIHNQKQPFFKNGK